MYKSSRAKCNRRFIWETFGRLYNVVDDFLCILCLLNFTELIIVTKCAVVRCILYVIVCH